MGHQAGIGASMLDYLQERANQVVTITQMESRFKGRYDRRQLMANMANLMKTPAGKEIERLQTGMWRYTSPVINSPIKEDKKPITSALFELVRELPDGHLLLGEDGELYRAKRIKL